MSLDPKQNQFFKLEQRLRRAQAVTPKLMTDVIAQACEPGAANGAAAKIRLERLIEAGAWTDATLAIVDLELPQWTLRQFVYDDGEWHCSLSKHPQMPLEFDATADASHEILPLAILIALLHARRDAAASATDATTEPRACPAPGYVVCCDNFF
jgi:hypothetical protein